RHGQANADTPRAGGNGAGDHQGRGQDTDWSKMVLSQPHRIHPAGLCFIYQRKTLGKGLLLTHPITAGKLDKQPDVHARTPFSPRPGPLKTLEYLLDWDGTGMCASVKRQCTSLTNRKKEPHNVSLLSWQFFINLMRIKHQIRIACV